MTYRSHPRSGPCAMKRIAIGIVGTVAMWGLNASVAAQDIYPSKAIRLVVAYAAGGGTDVAARIFAESLSRVPVSYTHLTLPTNREV